MKPLAHVRPNGASLWLREACPHRLVLRSLASFPAPIVGSDPIALYRATVGCEMDFWNRDCIVLMQSLPFSCFEFSSNHCCSSTVSRVFEVESFFAFAAFKSARIDSPVDVNNLLKHSVYSGSEKKNQNK